jgi:hypothetical protein
MGAHYTGAKTRQSEARRSREYRKRLKHNAKIDRQNAMSVLAVLRAPDANLRLMLAELTDAHERLHDDHKRLRAEYDALVALIEGD